MRIGIPDQHIEDQPVKEVADIQPRDGGPIAEQSDTIAEQRARLPAGTCAPGESQALAEILLMNARDRAVCADDTVISLT